MVRVSIVLRVRTVGRIGLDVGASRLARAAAIAGRPASGYLLKRHVMASKKPRIETNPAQAGLNQAFAGLDLGNLPAGPAEPERPVAAEKPARRGRVVLRKETAHRGGKAVIVVYDFEPQIDAALIEDLAKKLRAACGSGGTVRDRTIEIQGDQPGKVRQILEGEGFRVAGVGG